MKFYKIEMSTRSTIVIDENDFAKLTQNSATGNLIKLKKGIVNPSFIVSIYPIKQSEALEGEMPARRIEGELDETAGVFRMKVDTRPIGTELTDEF